STSCQGFMVPMRGIKVVQATHEPACSAGFPACGFTGLSSPVAQERATGKSPEPAGSKACATNPPRFMVPMRAKKSAGATHEPERGAPAPPGPVPAEARARARAELEIRSEEHPSELQSRSDLVCRLL